MNRLSIHALAALAAAAATSLITTQAVSLFNQPTLIKAVTGHKTIYKKDIQTKGKVFTFTSGCYRAYRDDNFNSLSAIAKYVPGFPNSVQFVVHEVRTFIEHTTAGKCDVVQVQYSSRNDVVANVSFAVASRVPILNLTKVPVGPTTEPVALTLRGGAAPLPEGNIEMLGGPKEQAATVNFVSPDFVPIPPDNPWRVKQHKKKSDTKKRLHTPPYAPTYKFYPLVS